MSQIRYVIGDATIPDTSPLGIHIITHCCNDMGYFHAGFVKPLKLRYRGVKQAYKNNIRYTQDPIGFVFIYKTHIDNLYIGNVIGQHDIYSHDGIPPIRYTSLKKGLISMIEMFASWEIHLHMPRIGCGLAGGCWDVVEDILNELWQYSNLKTISVYDLK